MNTKHSVKTLQLTAIATSFMAIFTSAHAELQSDEVRELVTPESSVSITIGEWSKDRRQQGQYDGMSDGNKTYGSVDIDVNTRDNATGTWVTIRGNGIGLKSSDLQAEWLRQGNIGVSFDYSRLQKENPLIFDIVKRQGIGTTDQSVIGANVGDGPGVTNLKTLRESYGLGFKKHFSKQLELNVSFRTEDKRGDRNWGRNNNFFSEPIDSQTNQIEAVLNYTTEKLQLSGGYYGSQYRNQNQWVRYGANANPGGDYLSLPFDNQSHQFYVNGGYELAPKTRLTFKLSYGRATQDDSHPDLLGVSAFGGLDGRIDTTLAELGIGSRPTPQLYLLANLRYQELDDRTPVRIYGSTGAAPNIVNYYNAPYSFRTRTGKLEATYRLPKGYSVTGGVDYKDQDRSIPDRNCVGGSCSSNKHYVPYRANLTEQIYRVDLRKSMSEVLVGAIGYHYSDRDGSANYRIDTPSKGADQVNPLHIADRIRHKVRASADWSPTEKFSAQFVLEASRDDYGGPAAVSPKSGLQDGEARLASIDLSYVFSEDWTAHAWYSRDETKANQFVVNPQGKTKMRENGDNLGLGLKGRLADQWIFGADLDWSRSVTKYDQSDRGVTPANEVPNIKNRLSRLSAYTDYEMNKKQTVRFIAIHEKWRTDDWTWTLANGNPLEYAGDGTTVTQNPRETSNFLGLRFSQKF